MFYKEKHFLYKTIYFKILILSYIILISLYIYKAATLSWQLWLTSWDAGVTAVDNASQKTTGYHQEFFSSAWQKVHPSLFYDHWFRTPEDYGSGARPSPLGAKARLHSGWQEDWKTTVVPNLPTHTCFPATLWLWGHSTNYHCITTLIKTQQSSGFQFLLPQKNY